MGNSVSLESLNEKDLRKLFQSQLYKESKSDKVKLYKLYLGYGNKDSEGTEGINGSLDLEKIRYEFYKKQRMPRKSIIDQLTGGAGNV